jgi:hypothetical protein
MKLELRKPTVVLLGAWNPAIFQATWLLRHGFGQPEGTQARVDFVQAQEIQMTLGAAVTAKITDATYFQSVGIGVTSERLEIYINENTAEVRSRAESVLQQLVSTLSHTPLANVGINFRLILEEQDVDLGELLETGEQLDELLPVLLTRYESSLELNNDCTLNILRSVSPEGSSLDLNFHHRPFRLPEFPEQIPGIIERCAAHAHRLFGGLYRVPTLEAFEILKHEFERPNPVGEV